MGKVGRIIGFVALGLGLGFLGAGFTGVKFMAFGFSATVGVGRLIALGSLLVLSSFRRRPQSLSTRFGRQLTVRQAVAPWRIVYGQTQTGGVITFLHVAGTSNEFLYLVLTVATTNGAGIEEVVKLKFGDEEVLLPSKAFNTIHSATGKYANHVRVEFKPGTDDQTASGLLTGAIGGKWTSDHRQRGHFHVALELKWNQELFQTFTLETIAVELKGMKVVDTRVHPTNRSYSNNWALCVRDFLTGKLGDYPYGAAAAAADIDDATFEAAANLADENVGLKAGGTEKRYAADGSAQVRGRYTHEHQQTLFAGDKGFEYVEAIQQMEITWGSKTISGGSSAPPSGLPPTQDPNPHGLPGKIFDPPLL